MSYQTRAENLAAALRSCEGELTALRAERDRYRKALERIASASHEESIYDIVRAALRREAGKR